MPKAMLLSLFLFLLFPVAASAQDRSAEAESIKQALLQAAKVSLAGDEILVYGVPQPSGPPTNLILEAKMLGKQIKARPKGDPKKRFVDLGVLKTGSADAILMPDKQLLKVEILALPPQQFQGDGTDVFDRPGF